MTDLVTDAKQEAALAYAITTLRRIDELFGPLDNVRQHTDTLSWMLHQQRETVEVLEDDEAMEDIRRGEQEPDDLAVDYDELRRRRLNYPHGYRFVDGQLMYSADWL